MQGRHGDGTFGIWWFWHAVIGILAMTAASLGVVMVLHTHDVAAAASAESDRYTPPPIVLPDQAIFIGDSYTQGRGSTAPDRKWVSIVAAHFGWEAINVGAGGTGFVTTSDVNGCGLAFCPNFQQVAAEAQPTTASYVFIAGGQNDFTAYTEDPAKETAAILATYEKVRARFPKAKIIAVGPSTPGTVGGTVVDMDKAVQAAARQVDAKYIDLLHPDVLSPSLLDTDLEHPNDKGHAAIAARVISALGG